MSFTTLPKRRGLPRYLTTVSVGVVFLWGPPTGVLENYVRHSVVNEVSGASRKDDLIERAMSSICLARPKDSQGTVPVDEMAAQDMLPLTDPRVIAGEKRARRLLPFVQKLIPLALSRIAAVHDLEPVNHGWIIARVESVNIIRPDPALRDNAAWRSNEPHAIVFGTNFLAGLRSDEAMIAVLAHELMHAINGTEQALQPLFVRVGARASQIKESPIARNAAIELTCELVGIQVVREYTAHATSKNTIRQRLARALQKNCVVRDLADEAHLSPRETMKLVLGLDPELSFAIAARPD